MLIIISAFRKSPTFGSFSKVANVFLMCAGAYLFLMQMHSYEHTANSEEYAVTASTQVVEKNTVTKDTSTKQSDWKDIITVSIPARDEIEYKVMVAKDESFQYAWESDKGELFFDFHGEPKGDTTGYFESFEKDTRSQSTGTIVTTFEGTHGWYWKNNNSHPVTITLKVNGNYQRLDSGADETQTTPADTNTPDKPKRISID